MSILFLDSFDHYSASQILRKWTAIYFGGGPGTIVAGRTGNGYRAGALDFPYKTLNAEYPKLTGGLAYKTESFANEIVNFTNVTNSVNFQLRHVGDGRLKLTFSGSGGGGESSPSVFTMSLNTWYFFEVQAEITAASPPHVIATARVNGAEILTWDYTHATSVSMKFATVGLQGPGAGLQATVDDFYCTDDEYLGDIRIGVLYPNAAGDSAGWTPNAAGANWEKVKEHPPDDDTTYVSAAGIGLKDLYNLDDISGSTGVIKGAQALWLTKKSDEGEAAVKGVWKSGGTEVTQASGINYLAPSGYHPSAASYLYNIQPARQSLFTAADWTAAEINALQLGITRTL